MERQVGNTWKPDLLYPKFHPGTPYEKAFRAVMRKHPKNIEGYVKAILEMKERIKKEKAKKEEADRQECEGL